MLHFSSICKPGLMTGGFCLTQITMTPVLCPGGTAVYLHVTFSFILYCRRWELNTHQGLPEMPLLSHPTNMSVSGLRKPGVDVPESGHRRSTRGGHLLIKGDTGSPPTGPGGPLKGPTSNALKKQFLGKLAGMGNRCHVSSEQSLGPSAPETSGGFL